MEEKNNKEQTEVELINSTIKLVRQDFIQMCPLINESQITQLKLPFSIKNQQKLKIINIMLYYILSVQKNIKIFENQSDNKVDKYRLICTNQMSDYYIKNKLNIELYEFSYICSKILQMKIQECAHILFYLVYGRFASHPYINTLCNGQNNKFGKFDEILTKRKNVLRVKQNNDPNSSSYSNKFYKGKNSNNLTTSNSNSNSAVKKSTEFELNIFRKQLKTALQSRSATGKFNKQSQRQQYSNNNNNNNNNKKLFKRSQQQFKQNTERLGATNRTYHCSYLPQRVSQCEKSSILENFSFYNQNNNNNGSMKCKMRKQKFNEYFNIKEFKLNKDLRGGMLVEDEKQNNQKKRVYFGEYSSLTNKINYQNFKNISNELKVQNENLDRIRNQCNLSYELKLKEREYAKNNKNNLKSMEIYKELGHVQNQYNLKQQKQLICKVNGEGVKSNNDNDNAILRIGMEKQDKSTQKQKQLVKNNVNNANNKKVQLEQQYDDGNFEQFGMNLLRNELHVVDRESDGDKNKKLNYLLQTSLNGSQKNHHTRLKLQKYKSDYRRFMKTQLLDRIKQSVN